MSLKGFPLLVSTIISAQNSDMCLMKCEILNRWYVVLFVKKSIDEFIRMTSFSVDIFALNTWEYKQSHSEHYLCLNNVHKTCIIQLSILLLIWYFMYDINGDGLVYSSGRDNNGHCWQQRNSRFQWGKPILGSGLVHMV